jgi:hypothetical protein
MMKTIILASLMAILLCGGLTAQQKTFGLGIIAGEPTGPCFKLWTSGRTAIDGALAWSFSHHTSLHLHADYLMHSFGAIKVEKGKLPIYYGIGGRIKFVEGKGDDQIGVRVPVGLAYIFADAPLDLFIEVVPVLDLTPDTEMDFNAALGVRFFF